MNERLSREKALLIVCKALTPFVMFDLVQTTDQGVEPHPEAEEFGIKDTLAQLHKRDESQELHVIDTILNTIFDLCRKEGFGVAIGKGELVDGEFTTIKELANELYDTSMPI